MEVNNRNSCHIIFFDTVTKGIAAVMIIMVIILVIFKVSWITSRSRVDISIPFSSCFLGILFLFFFKGEIVVVVLDELGEGSFFTGRAVSHML